MSHLNLQAAHLINSDCSHQMHFHKFWMELCHVTKFSKIDNFTKLRLVVKPPLKISMFSHNVKFSKSVVLVGG